MASMTVGFGEVAHYALLTQDAEGDYALISDRDMVDGLRVKVDMSRAKNMSPRFRLSKRKLTSLASARFPAITATGPARPMRHF